MGKTFVSVCCFGFAVIFGLFWHVRGGLFYPSLAVVWLLMGFAAAAIPRSRR